MINKFKLLLEEKLKRPVFNYIDNLAEKITFNKDTYYLNITEVDCQRYLIKGALIYAGSIHILYNDFYSIENMSLINNIKIMTDVTGYTCYQEFTYSFPKEWLELYQQEVQEIRSV